MMRVKIALLMIGLAMASAAAKDAAGNAGAFRQIPIPKREHGYGSNRSIVIRSQADLKAFLKTIRSQNTWNNRKAFEEAITKAKIDFSKEALVLLRHTEGSGSVKVTFKPPVLSKKTLACEVARQEPEMGTADMAYYCFALAVSKTRVQSVTLTARGKTATLPVTTK